MRAYFQEIGNTSHTTYDRNTHGECQMSLRNPARAINEKKDNILKSPAMFALSLSITLERVFSRAAPAFDNLFMGSVFNTNIAHKTVEKLTFQSFY